MVKLIETYQEVGVNEVNISTGCTQENDPSGCKERPRRLLIRFMIQIKMKDFEAL